MPAGVQSVDGRAFAFAVPESDIDIRALMRSVWRKRWWVIIPTLIAAALAVLAVELITPKYKSEARVLFSDRENVFLRPEADKTTLENGTVDPDAVASEVQLVLSRDLARKVITQLNLGALPEFDIMLRGESVWRKAAVILGLAKDPTRMTPEERVLEAYYERLTVYPVDKSRVIVIEFQSWDPELAARVANAIAQAYLEYQQAAKRQQARAASEWLAGEIDKMRVRVREAEDKVEQFRTGSNLFMGNNNTPLANQQLGDLANQLAAARAQRADAEARAHLIRATLRSGQPLESSDLLNSELIRRLTEQRVTLRAQLAEQSATLLDGHPRIKELKAQIADVEGQIREEADKLAHALENEAQVAGNRVETLTGSLDGLKQQAAATGQQDVELHELEREAKAQRDLLESYLARYREATARENIDAAPSDARIISRAVVSNTPAFPKKVPIVVVATLATLVLFSGFITTGELMKATPYRGALSEAVVSETAGVAASVGARAMPPPVSFGAAPSAAPMPATPGEGPVRPVEEVARALHAAGEGGHRVSIVGTKRDIGTTQSALALARALARNAKVVLVDLALGAPNLSAFSAEPGAPGIADLVRGTASFGQIITRDKESPLHLITAGRAAADATAILASQRIATTIEALARTYAHVVIDAGALGEIALERFAQLAPKGVLVAPKGEDVATHLARERLLRAGFADVIVLVFSPQGAAGEPQQASAMA